MLKTGSLAVTFSLVLAAISNGQTILGLTDGSLQGTPIALEWDSACHIRNRCAFPFAPVAIPPGAGGIAYDYSNRTWWMTTGRRLLHLDVGCHVISSCAVPASSTLPWSGLAVDPEHERLYHVEQSTTIYVSNLACPQSAPVALCNVGAPLGVSLAGIEVDPRNASLWVVDQRGNVANIEATLGGIACRILDTFRITCPQAQFTLPVTGITVDRCRSLVHVSDSAGHVATAELSTGILLGCCRLQGAGTTLGPLVGLARKPADVRRVGMGCSGGACPPCSPVASTNGEAHIPNGEFAIEVTGAPSGSRGFLLMNVGGGPVSTPLFCGPLHVDLLPPPIFLGPIGIPPASNPCGGSTAVRGPIVADPAFCGAVIHAQWLIFCLNGGHLGHSLSNGLVIPFS